MLTQKASKEIRDGEIVQPTVQKKYVEFFENDDLNWKEIYSLPYQVAWLSHVNFNINCYTDIWPPVFFFLTKLVFLHHHDVLSAMGRMNPLVTFLSLARLLRVLGQKLLNGVSIGGGY